MILRKKVGQHPAVQICRLQIIDVLLLFVVSELQFQCWWGKTIGWEKAQDYSIC